MSEPLDAPDPGQEQEKNPNFQIIFNGLCAFVPSSDIDTTKPDKVDVLLINTEHPRAEKLKYDHKEEHRALLKYELKDVDPGANPSKDACGLWMLEDEQLTLEILTRNEEVGVAESPKRPLKLKLDKVPRIDKILPEARELDPEATGDKPDLVIARMTIDQGILEPFRIGSFMNEEIVAQFVPPEDPPVVHALVTKLRLAFNLNSDEEVVIHSKNFGPGLTAGDVRQLTLKAPPPDRLVEISVSNLCCGRFMDYEADEIGELPAQDTDFEYHFLLSKEFERLVEKRVRLPIPVPVKYKVVKPDLSELEPAGGGETIRCNLSLINPKPTAIEGV